MSLINRGNWRNGTWGNFETGVAWDMNTMAFSISQRGLSVEDPEKEDWKYEIASSLDCIVFAWNSSRGLIAGKRC